MKEVETERNWIIIASFVDISEVNAVGLESSVRGSLVVSVLDCQSWGSGLNSCAHSQLSYDEYTDRTPTVERWDGEGEDWPSARICRDYENKVATISYPWP